MCLGIPAKILAVEGSKAVVSLGGNEYKADISLLEEVKTGDYILLHAGFGIQKISHQHARETLDLIEEMKRTC